VPRSRFRHDDVPLLAPFRRHWALTAVTATLAMAGRVVVPVAVRHTTGADLRDGTHVAILAVAAVCGVVVAGVSSYLTNVRVLRAAEEALAAVRTAAFARVHQMPAVSLDRERRGVLVANVTTDLDALSAFLQSGGLAVVLSCGQILAATALMAVYSWQLTLSFWGFALPVAFGFRSLRRTVARTYAEVREDAGNMLATLSETLVGAEMIRACAAHGRAQAHIDTTIDAYSRKAWRTARLSTNGFAAAMFVSGLVLLVVVEGGAWLGVTGELDLGRMLAFLFLIQLIMLPLQAIAESLGLLQNAVAGWRRVSALLRVPVEVNEPGGSAVDLPRGPAEIRFENVGFAYPGGSAVLQNVNLTVQPGCRVAVVGRTGSGKTTLGKLLARLLDPTEGRITMDGVDLRRVRPSALRARVAYVAQEGFLFDRSVAENIAWGRPGAGHADIVAALAQLGLIEWALSLPLGVATPAGQVGQHLSAGERQFVALARVFLAGPDVLVLDEAASDIDPATEARLATALSAATRGRTCVSIAHRLSTAEAADLVVVVDGGRVVDVGAHKDLLGRCPAYRRLHRAPQPGQPCRTGATPREPFGI
jgi:ATP-binding cassette, subfamily B, bacterial